MTLDQFKEKLFRKANSVSVEIDYSGFIYKIAYSNPNKCTRVTATSAFNSNNKDLNYIQLTFTNLKDTFSAICFFDHSSFNKEIKEFEEFLDKIEKLGVLDE